MTLPAMPRITRLDLAHVVLPEGHPAAAHGRSVPVHGFLIEHPVGPILVETKDVASQDNVDKALAELLEPSFAQKATQ